jgi:FHS family glucose/mannose:H+ symporter-like MFS transporter
MGLSRTNRHSLPRFQPGWLQPLLHIGFAFTGVGTVLLGAILPRVALQWHLRDQDAGLMLFVQFAAAACGALLARRNLWRTLAGGYALAGAGALAIPLLQQQAFPFLLVAFGVLGLGLGLAMTSTNLLVGKQYTQGRGAALALLNFSWSAGAVACPLLVFRFFSGAAGSTLFGWAGLLLLPFALLPMAAHRSMGPAANATANRAAVPGEARTIVYFALLAFLYVGIEATVGNWISTYASRAASPSLAGGSIAVAIFWAALLLGRGLTPVSLSWLTEPRLYRICMLAVVGGLGLLIEAHGAHAMLAGAALTGMALAPLFPLTISLFLAEIGETRNAGWVFAVAGWGGALFSWLTGLVSGATGSLRLGLLVPGASAVLMTVLIVCRRPRRTGVAIAAGHSALQPGA